MRHLHMTPGPSLADPTNPTNPTNQVVFLESRYHDQTKGQEHKIWGGWRCRLIRWLIVRWMPEPTVWLKDYLANTTRTTDPS
jgi:hypothetical protein